MCVSVSRERERKGEKKEAECANLNAVCFYSCFCLCFGFGFRFSLLSGFMETIEDLFVKIKDTRDAEFRLFFTCEPHPKFPIGLLQMAIKVTNEPPNGLRAGLMRSYTVMIDQDRLERVETSQWRALLFTLCFMHSVVQERRKFGALGWCIPYEYNDGDLNACITFLEKHLYQGALSWPTLQYMVADVQYGGKITDDLDRRLFKTYAESWVGPMTLAPNFTFNPESPLQRIPNDFTYVVPDCSEVDEYLSFINGFPETDSPEVFGLHPNADISFRNKEVQQLLNTIVETQPKTSSAGGGRTREDIVYEKCEELLESMPADYIEDDFLERINGMGGLAIPLNIFLFQELQRLQMVIHKARATLGGMMQAIRGEIVLSAEIADAINAVFDAFVPPSWTHSPGGDEISWLCPTLGLWYSGLTSRDEQYRGWLMGGRPVSFWMTGFFNPQGFLTAVQQEVTRAHKADKWALDGVQITTEVTEFDRIDQVRAAPREGVYVHGLFLDGATWNKPDASLAESEPKKLFTPLPVMFTTAVTKSAKRAGAGDYGPYGGYECPVYKYPKRTDRYIIFSVMLASREHKPAHWGMRAVALLCACE